MQLYNTFFSVKEHGDGTAGRTLILTNMHSPHLNLQLSQDFTNPL